MTPARAIILAAGSGSRLRPFTADRPKCLLDIGGRALIEWQVEALSRCGVNDVTVVVGYYADRVRAQLQGRARCIESLRYRETNSLYSLWLARDELAHGSIVLNSDVLASPRLFQRLCTATAPDAVLVDPDQVCEVEEMKVTLANGLVVDFGKDLAPELCHGENVGLVKFGPEAGTRLSECLSRLVAEGHEGDWAPRAYRELAQHWPLHAVMTNGLPWIEIDYPDDLERASREIVPAILAIDLAARAG